MKKRVAKGKKEPSAANAIPFSREESVAVVETPKGECRGLGHLREPGNGCVDPAICHASWKCALNTWP
jgi:hypothetical protein